MITIKRKLYKRGSSFETTIPMPLLFALDLDKKYHVLFNFDQQSSRWYVEFEEAGETEVKQKEVRQKRGKKK